METAPVCAALEWRRVRVWGSGIFLILSGPRVLREYLRGLGLGVGRDLEDLPVWTEQHCVWSYEGFD